MNDWRQHGLEQDEHDYRVQMRANLDLERRDEEDARDPENLIFLPEGATEGIQVFWPGVVLVGLAVLLVLWELFSR